MTSLGGLQPGVLQNHPDQWNQSLGWEPRNFNSSFEKLIYHSNVVPAPMLKKLSFVLNLLYICRQVIVFVSSSIKVPVHSEGKT